MTKKILGSTVLLFGLVILVLFGLRDFLIKWGANTFLLVGTPYSVHLQSVETHPKNGLNHFSFKIEGTFESAPFTTEGVLQLIPLRADPFKMNISNLPLTDINRRVVLKTGFIFTRGTMSMEASGTVTPLELNLNAEMFLADFAVKKEWGSPVALKEDLLNFMAASHETLKIGVYISGNPLDPHMQWSENIQNVLSPVEKPVKMIEKDMTPLKKWLPHRI